MSTISASTTSTTAFKVTSDTTGNLVLQTGSGPTTAVSIDTNQNVTFAGYANLPNTFGFKNRIINGAMVIDQRNAGASVTPADTAYTLDRWWIKQTTASKFSIQQSTTSPAGFGFSAAVTSLSAYSIGSSDIYAIRQNIEGFNFADMAWGTASAATVTLSFWVRSSLTGTFGGAISNSAQNRSYPFVYTINSANTWEQKTVTIAGDTTGTWVGATNGTGAIVTFGLGVGSTYSGTAGAWAGADYKSATGATSVVGTNGATFYITGVQLEKGSTATSFDFRDYGRELIMCQRYYEKSYDTSTVPGTNTSAGLRWAGGTTFNDANLGVQQFFKVEKRSNGYTVYFWTDAGTSGQWTYVRSGASGSGTAYATYKGTSYFLPYTGVGVGQNFVAATVYGHYAVDDEL